MPRLRTVARTAVISGTATAVSGNVARRQNDRWAAQQAPAEAPPVAAPPAPVAAAPAAAEDPIEKLKQLGELHQAGVLTDEEFAAAKAKVLGG